MLVLLSKTLFKKFNTDVGEIDPNECQNDHSRHEHERNMRSSLQHCHADVAAGLDETKQVHLDQKLGAEVDDQRAGRHAVTGPASVGG